MKILLVIYLYFIMVIAGYPEVLELDNISTTEGISQSSITSITQDSIGFLWFGTYDGLNRFDGYEFKVFRHDPYDATSISHNFIRALCTDKKGNIWIGTTGGGLNFFDSERERFISFKYDSSDSNSITFNSITALMVDNSDNLWIGTDLGGVNCLSLSEFYKKKNDISNRTVIFKSYKNTDVGVTHDGWNRITSIYQDHNNEIWIGTRYGLSKFEPVIEKFTHFFSNPEDPHSLSDNNITTICEDNFGNLWVGNWGDGLNKYINSENRFIRYSLNPSIPKHPSLNMIMTLYKDRSDDLWIGTWGGGIHKLVSLDEKEDSFIHYKKNQEGYTLDNLSIFSFYEDKFGVFWIGSDWNGLYKNIKSGYQFKHYYSDLNVENLQNKNNVFHIYKDRSGIIWLGTRFGGIYLYDIKNKKFSYFNHDPNDPFTISHNKIRVLFEDRNGKLWIGTEIGLDRYDYKTKKFIHYSIGKENPYSTNIFCISDDRYNNLWVGTYGAGLYRLNMKTNEVFNYIHNTNDPKSIGDNIIWDIHEDQQGNLWIGTDNAGLNRFNYTTDQFIRYKSNPINRGSLTGDKILTIFESKSGVLWFGTTSGLNEMNNIDSLNFNFKPSFTHYTKDNGLPSNTIHGILEDDHGNLWISTNNGLSKFNPKTKKFQNFNISHGLQDKEFSVNSCFKDTLTGEMYFGGINGFNVFHPDSICLNTIPPEIVLTKLKILNESISINERSNSQIILKKSLSHIKELYLSYKDITFSLTFSALHFISPMNNLYAYKMDGFEKKWNYVNANQRTVTYTNLDPGEYLFRVKASNNDEIWSDKERILKIIITPPFWMTWWFRILVIFIIAGIIFTIYVQRTRRIKNYNKELEENVKNRTRQLELSNKELESFAYSVSHDLKTPIRGINGYTKILKEDFINEFSEESKKYFDKILRSANRMGELIDNLIKLSRIMRSKIEIEQVDLSKIALEISEDLSIAYPERKVLFKIQSDIYVEGDTGLMRTVLTNLIQNAWKFTEHVSQAKIEFDYYDSDGQKVFYIKDNGVGYNMKYADKLFMPFSRLHSDNEYEGMGIGLASVRKIIEKHGGKIWAEGKVNEGATFYFTLS